MTPSRTIPTTALLVGAGHLLFAALLVLAIQHVQARTIHVDSACQVFKWINGHGVQFEAHRYSAVFPQLLVKFFAWCGASLASLLLVASVAHVLVPWVLFAVIAHALRMPWLAAASALAAVLCTRLTFYGIVLEVNYLLCYPFLLAAALQGLAERSARGRWMLLAVFAWALVLLVHPVGALVALFIIALFALQARERGFLLVLGAATVAWLFLGRVLLPPTSYEQGVYDGVAAGLTAGGEGHALDFLLGHSWGHYTTHYLVWWVLLGLLSVLLVRRCAWWTLALVLGACTSFIALTVLTYHRGEAAMMMEKNFLPLAVLVALPLLLEVQRLDQGVPWRYAVPFLLLLFVQFRSISFAARPMNERLAHLATVVREARATGRGAVQVQAADLDARGLHVLWALPYETLLLSGVEGPRACVMVTAMNGAEPAGHVLDASTLDPRWFQLPAAAEPILSSH